MFLDSTGPSRCPLVQGIQGEPGTEARTFGRGFTEDRIDGRRGPKGLSFFCAPNRKVPCGGSESEKEKIIYGDLPNHH